ncbi:Putative nuclease HARBI1, partial [Harpegnathos saltator]
HFEIWDEKEFLQRFRLSKATVHMLIGKIQRSCSITKRQVLICSFGMYEMMLPTSKFYAGRSFLTNIADFVDVYKSTATKVTNKVSRAIVQLRPAHVKFPKAEEDIQRLGEKFDNIARFPRLCECPGDCTHIRIKSP